MTKKVIALIVLCVAIVLASWTLLFVMFFGSVGEEILVEYKGNFPQGTIRATIGDEEFFTNGPDIEKVILYEDKCFYTYQIDSGEYVCPLNFGIEISDVAAQRFVTITSDLEVVDNEYLSEDVILYFKSEKIDVLKISAELKGKFEKNLAVSFSGKGATDKLALQDALQTRDELVNVFLDKK